MTLSQPTSELSATQNMTLAHKLPPERNPALVYLAGLKAVSRRPQRHALDSLAGLLTGGSLDALAFPWHALRFQHTAALRSRLLDASHKPATVNRMLSALRGVLKAAWRLELMSSEDYHRAADVQSVLGESLPAGRELAAGEIAALMAACENDATPAGARDAAIIALLYAGGLRRAEVVSLSLAGYDFESGRLLVHGKRSKERTVYMTGGAFRAMADWLAVRGRDGDALFCAINKGGRLNTAFPMTDQAVYNMLEKRAAGAGVKAFSPHDLRRTFVSDLLDAGADIATVAKMAGHASVNTTARYDRRPEQAKQKAAGLLHVPYRGRLV